MIVNALTIDVEDFFHVNAFSRRISRDDWDSYKLRVGENTSLILDMLDEFSVQGTFFILGWVAEKVPLLVKAIKSRGHEIGCHGFNHQLIYDIGPSAFRDDIKRAKMLLEDILGEEVCGYRAPSYSITTRSLWAVDILIEEGFRFDSSIFPIIHDTYGIPGAARFPHTIKTASGSLLEFPLSTLPIKIAGTEHRIPIAGGGYLRLLPVEFVRKGIERINAVEQQPAVLYFHPWEVDPDQPRINAGIKARFRHYVNIAATEGKLRRLLDSLPFATMGEVLKKEANWNAGENISFESYEIKGHVLQSTTL